MLLSGRFISLVLLWLWFLLSFSPVVIWAGPDGYQQCPIGDNCTIGEFLYDDEYAPITDASCSLTSRDPDGNLFLNSVAMSAQSDGWYSYDVTTTGEDEGIYRSQVCCTSGSDYLCIDKTFEMFTPASSTSLSAADVWSYSSRSLTDFGSLVDAIWNRGTRTLTGAGISGNNLATQGSNTGADLTSLNTSLENIAGSISILSGQVTQNQNLIEQLDSQVTNNFLTTISNETVESLTISSIELNSISSETNEIVSLLENSEYYEQAASIQDEILNSIETINNLQTIDPDDPKAVIENYQKTTSELASIVSNLGRLQELVEKAREPSTVGLTGGFLASPLGWIGLGLLLLLLMVAMVFLVAYIRILLIKQSRRQLAATRQSVENELHSSDDDRRVPHAPASPFGATNWAKFFSIVLITGSVSALLTGGLLVTVARSERAGELARLGTAKTPESEPMVMSKGDEIDETSDEVVDSSAEDLAGVAVDSEVLGASSSAIVKVDGDNMANVRVEGRPDAVIVTQLPSGYKILILEEFDGWVRIEFESDGRVRTGWMWEELVEY